MEKTDAQTHQGPTMAQLGQRYPCLSIEIAQALRDADEAALADQVPTLPVGERCGCGDDFCQSFHTAPVPEGPWGPGHRTVSVEPPWPGYLVFDVVDEHIAYVEVLYRKPLD